jgi:hypothetical protein
VPWKECNVEDERLRFVACRLDGEAMAALEPVANPFEARNVLPMSQE